MERRVLFVCEGNRARSQLAEALLRFHSAGRFEAFSAGIRPGKSVLQETLDVLNEMGVPADGLQAKHYDEFAGEEFDWLVTVCDKVRDESPPLPPARQRIHWSVEDPADAQARGLTLHDALRESRRDLRARIIRFINEQGCVFCSIARGEEAASLVYEDDLVVGFVDIRPITPGHLLVIPREHCETMDEAPEETAGRMTFVAGRLAKALERCGAIEGYNLFVANGEPAGQEVLHVHMHVLPRFRGDGFGFRFPPGYGRIARREELDELAARVREVMAG